MENPKQQADNLAHLKTEAQKSVVERNGQWVIELDPSVKVIGHDPSKSYPSKEVATEAAMNLLKGSQKV